MEPYKTLDYCKVEQLAAAGLSQQQIAASLGVSRRTITRRLQDDELFADAFDKGRASLCEELSSLLLDQARNGSTDAIKFALDRRCGWVRETKSEIEVKPGPSVRLIFPKDMEELQAGA